MKLLVIGHARWGKDTVCEILRDKYQLTFESSSAFVAEKAVRPWLAARGIVYPTYEAMYADRVNHRAEWKTAIGEYNSPDPSKLGKEIFAAFDIYCGCREPREVHAMRTNKAFDFCFWVDARLRHPPEHESSMGLTENDADWVVDNNKDLFHLEKQVDIAYKYARLALREE